MRLRHPLAAGRTSGKRSHPLRSLRILYDGASCAGSPRPELPHQYRDIKFQCSRTCRNGDSRRRYREPPPRNSPGIVSAARRQFAAGAQASLRQSYLDGANRREQQSMDDARKPVWAGIWDSFTWPPVGKGAMSTTCFGPMLACSISLTFREPGMALSAAEAQLTQPTAQATSFGRLPGVLVWLLKSRYSLRMAPRCGDPISTTLAWRRRIPTVTIWL